MSSSSNPISADNKSQGHLSVGDAVRSYAMGGLIAAGALALTIFGGMYMHHLGLQYQMTALAKMGGYFFTSTPLLVAIPGAYLLGKTNSENKRVHNKVEVVPAKTDKSTDKP